MHRGLDNFALLGQEPQETGSAKAVWPRTVAADKLVGDTPSRGSCLWKQDHRHPSLRAKALRCRALEGYFALRLCV